ncbi:MAG TPA: cyanophycin synthetase [Candidatus Thermoplasmatota archaeon]|nr:cyanophycin synthetase [Candidatus Thermoplasmatota archaeon]
MRILEHRALRGPNYHAHDPVIFMRLDIGDLEKTPSDEIPGFTDRLLEVMPSLREHRCSPGYPGGFVERLRRGTWAAHIVEHVAIELQSLAGMEVGFGKTRTTKQRGVYTIVYRYLDEESGLQAGREAVDLVEAVAAGRVVELQPILRRLHETKDANAFGPSTGALVEEARRRGIPVLRLNEGSYVQLGYGARQQRIQATMTGRTSGIGVEIAGDKDRTKRVLADAGIPVPKGEAVRTLRGALEVAEELGYPVVVKPLNGNHGRGITTNIRTPQDLEAAFETAQKVSPEVIIERYLQGCDFRLLVINYKFVAAARRDPAHVVGNGRSTVRELIDAVNADPRRGEGHERALTRIRVDKVTEWLLAQRGLTLDSVVPEGEVVVLKTTANLSSGGTATDVTDEVHPAVRLMAERIARIVDLDIMGIDVVAPHLRKPLHETGGGVVEVNAAPGFRMHLEPTTGTRRNVAAPVLDMLFPNGSKGTIPIVAVTGTNGKTTTVSLISHILTRNGARVGTATTTGVELQGQVVVEGDYSGPSGAQFVLREPTVDHAVLEVARGGILRRGLGFEECDVGILLNVSTDHLGEGGIDTLEDLSRLKGTVVEAVKRSGTAVLNADDPLVLAFRERLRCNIALFSLDPDNPVLEDHLDSGGCVVTVVGNSIVLRQGLAEFDVADVRDIPLTLNGKATFNIQNVMAAVAAAHALGVPEDVLRGALATFTPSYGQIPGRMNLFDVGGFKVLIDYGHNVAALQALAKVLPYLSHGRRINVGSASGNRRDQDLEAFGRTLAGMYDMIFLCDPDPRGRAPGETAQVIERGILSTDFPASRLFVYEDELDAIDAALAEARDGDLVVVQADDIRAAVQRVREVKEELGPRPASTPAASDRFLTR